MDKIVLVCKKKDDSMEKLIKCLKSLFPESSLEAVNSEPDRSESGKIIKKTSDEPKYLFFPS